MCQFPIEEHSSLKQHSEIIETTLDGWGIVVITGLWFEYFSFGCKLEFMQQTTAGEIVSLTSVGLQSPFTVVILHKALTVILVGQGLF